MYALAGQNLPGVSGRAHPTPTLWKLAPLAKYHELWAALRA
jgi:hypothetical protein